MMNFNFPFFRFPSFNRRKYNSEFSGTARAPFPTVHNIPFKNKISTEHKNNNASDATEKGSTEKKEFLDIFGIRLYYDDILLISLIFVLYNEGVDDNELFIALILLLLS